MCGGLKGGPGVLMDKEVPSGTHFMEILMPHLQHFSEVPTSLKFSLEDGWVVVEILRE